MISRAEQGSHTLSPSDARVYAVALGASMEQADELVELCTAAEPEVIAGQARVLRRGPEIQRRVRDLEQQSVQLRQWQPMMIPGLLQTWDYTVALIEREPDDRWATQRRARLSLLDDETHSFQFVIYEGALWWSVGSPEIMDVQLRWLVEVSRRPHVDVGVLPFGQTAIPPTESSFHLYEDRAAVVATDVGTTFLTDRGDLDALADTFRRLAAVAAHGDDARALIGRASRSR